jgi:hypothetical protein
VRGEERRGTDPRWGCGVTVLESPCLTARPALNCSSLCPDIVLAGVVDSRERLAPSSRCSLLSTNTRQQKALYRAKQSRAARVRVAPHPARITESLNHGVACPVCYPPRQGPCKRVDSSSNAILTASSPLCQLKAKPPKVRPPLRSPVRTVPCSPTDRLKNSRQSCCSTGLTVHSLTSAASSRARYVQSPPARHARRHCTFELTRHPPPPSPTPLQSDFKKSACPRPKDSQRSPSVNRADTRPALFELAKQCTAPTSGCKATTYASQTRRRPRSVSRAPPTRALFPLREGHGHRDTDSTSPARAR